MYLWPRNRHRGGISGPLKPDFGSNGSGDRRDWEAGGSGRSRRVWRQEVREGLPPGHCPADPGEYGEAAPVLMGACRRP